MCKLIEVGERLREFLQIELKCTDVVLCRSEKGLVQKGEVFRDALGV